MTTTAKMELKELREYLLNRREEVAANKDLLPQFIRDFELLIERLSFNMQMEDDNSYGVFLMECTRIINFELPAPAAVSFRGMDGFNLYFNPLMFLELADENGECANMMKDVIRHELEHIIRFHLPRAKEPLSRNAPHLLVNGAMDTAINQHLKYLPDWCWSLESIANALGIPVNQVPRDADYEVYLKMLLQKKEENQQQQQQSGQGQGGAGGGSSQQQQQQDDSSQDDSQQGQNGQDKDDSQSGQGHQGKDADKPREEHSKDWKWDNSNGDDKHSTWNEVPSNGDTSMDSYGDVLKGALDRTNQNKRGTLPGSMQNALDELSRPPQISWQRLLKSEMSATPVPYKKTITRKSRRLPNIASMRGRLNDREPVVIVAYDTSGSVSDKELEYGFNELKDILKLRKSKVHILECDTRITRHYMAQKVSDIKYEVTGRGGTYFQPVFDWVTEQNIHNAIIIFFTDGGGERQVTLPKNGNRVIWVCTYDIERFLSTYQNLLDTEGVDYVNKYVKRLHVEDQR